MWSGGAQKFKQVYWEGIGFTPVKALSDTGASGDMAASTPTVLTVLGGMCIALLAWTA
jgi:hypothetical protein